MQVLNSEQLYCDVGLMSHLSEELEGSIMDLIQDGVFGFVAYLSPTFNPKLPFLKSKLFLKKFLQFLEEKKLQTAVGIFCEEADQKELSSASPYRLRPMHHRL